MTEERLSLEDRVALLAAQVHALTLRMEELETRAAMPERITVLRQPVEEKQAAAVAASEAKLPTGEPGEVAEDILTWAGKASLLPRLATLCFLLVVALALRTITDNNLIDKLLGSMLGMGYAAILILVGWYRYSKASPLAPVFAACGAVLMSTIVVETHAHFQSLPLVPAYVTLMATSIGMAVISYQYNVFTPISVGTLGMCLAGAAIDYPHPFFPYLAMVLLTANILGYFAAQIKRCSWLRWIVLVVTLLMLHLWALRLATSLMTGTPPPPEFAQTWFFPALGIFFIAYLAIALLGIVRSGTGRVAKFDFSLPTVNAVWTFTASYYVVAAYGGNRAVLGAMGLIAAAGHLGMGFWLAGRKLARAPGTNSFVFAGSVLLALALPLALGNTLAALPVLSAVALGLALISARWKSGGVRVSSYALQAYAAIALAISLFSRTPPPSTVMAVISAALLSGTGLFHYWWCRKHAPPLESTIFPRLDPRDRSAVVLFMASLASAFFMLRVLIYQALAPPSGGVNDAFRCGQSVLITSAAAGLMLFAYFRKDKEIRNVAILVTVIGAIKVFLYDLLGTHGVPLVVSMFSFGLAAALESIVLGRWQRHLSTGEGK